jgi:hypothetical protein
MSEVVVKGIGGFIIGYLLSKRAALHLSLPT